MASTLPDLPLFRAIASHDPNSTAVIHSSSGRRFTYGQLLGDIAKAKDMLHHKAGKTDLNGERIAFIVENSYDYVVTLLSVISARGIALPMSPGFPAQELQYIMEQSQASMLLASGKFFQKALEVEKQGLSGQPDLIELGKLVGQKESENVSLEACSEGNGGIMLYTSGTTSRPKGVLLPQSVITAQADSLLQAWKYSPADHLLHVLPLHHIHGIVNAILAPLLAGSTIEFLFPFNATAVWKRLGKPFLLDNFGADKVTFLTAVPTVYNRLLDSHGSLDEDLQSATKVAISPENLRLNISGSAALPTPTKTAWAVLSNGNVLLERYGMTEVGMALSCGLDFADRVDGSVGWPLPSVKVRLVDTESGNVIEPGQERDTGGKERDGEIQLQGPTIFKEYWQNGRATREAFVKDDEGSGIWFKTGDIAVRRHVPTAGNSHQQWAKGAMYFIRGRKSADIIKTGGEKVSALEVERELLSIPEIAEAAVVAVPSGKWGQKVGAVIVLKTGILGKDARKWGPMDMRRALRDRLANYKIPQTMKIVKEIPRNAMGKVNKAELVKAVFSDEASGDEL